jgi:hypothetical protein
VAKASSASVVPIVCRTWARLGMLPVGASYIYSISSRAAADRFNPPVDGCPYCARRRTQRKKMSACRWCRWGQVLNLNFGSVRSMIMAPRIKGFTNRLRPSER